MTEYEYTRAFESQGFEGPLRVDRYGNERFRSSPESRCQQNAPCDGCRWCRSIVRIAPDRYDAIYKIARDWAESLAAAQDYENMSVWHPSFVEAKRELTGSAKAPVAAEEVDVCVRIAEASWNRIRDAGVCAYDKT